MYKIKTSERNNDRATEFETKSLLYLMTKIKNHQIVDLFIIDCFNDITGATSNYLESWDVQSKGVSSLTPRTVGKALYTLFSNYISEIDFSHYVLFLPRLKDSYLDDPQSVVFGINDFKNEKIRDVKLGLQVEIEKRNDPDVATAHNILQIDSFLSNVFFITDKYEKADYICSIIEFKNIEQLDEEFLTRIFDEIRTQQAAKKIRNVCGEEIASLRDAEKFDKTIHRKDIELLVVNRIIGNDLFATKGIPLYFIQEVQDMNEDDIADLIQDCQSKIGRTLFNKNNKKSFWLLLEEIMSTISENKNIAVRDAFGKISNSLQKKVFSLDEISMLYLIALVKEGLKHENS